MFADIYCCGMKLRAEKLKRPLKSTDVTSKRAPRWKEGGALLKVANEALTPLRVSLLNV